MADVLKHLERLSKYAKREARLEMAEAEEAMVHQQEVIAENAQRVDDERENHVIDDPMEVARYHAFRLRMEMLRRREVEKLTTRTERVDNARGHLDGAIRRAQTIERLLELKSERQAAEDRKTESNILDELGLQGWWRRTA